MPSTWYPTQPITLHSRQVDSAFSAFEGINPLLYNPYTQPAWEAAVAEYERSLAPVEQHVSGNFRRKVSTPWRDYAGKGGWPRIHRMVRTPQGYRGSRRVPDFDAAPGYSRLLHIPGTNRVPELFLWDRCRRC
jgi:hypothetical protein